MNNKDVKAFEVWSSMLALMEQMLDKAETNFDVESAMTTTRLASDASRIFESGLEFYGGSAETLSNEIGYAMMWLDEATHAIFFGNKTGTVTLRNLEQSILNKIENLTTPIRNLVTSTYRADISENGVSLAQQLQEKNLIDQLITYCREIRYNGQQIYNYYHSE